MKKSIKLMAILAGGLAWSPAATAAEAPAATQPARGVQGIDRGGPTLMVCVARDKAAWEAIKHAAGKGKVLPIGTAQGNDLGLLDATDFQRQMIVAVFWGEMAFSGQGEKCWIEGVTVGKEEVVVNCRATLWGGAVKHAYRAWPYYAKVVARNDLPVRFRQSTELKANPGRSEKDKTIGIVKAGAWKGEASVASGDGPDAAAPGKARLLAIANEEAKKAYRKRRGLAAEAPVPDFDRDRKPTGAVHHNLVEADGENWRVVLESTITVSGATKILFHVEVPLDKAGKLAGEVKFKDADPANRR